MASPTPNKGYTYPAHGGAVNAWDTPLNADFDQIDLNVGGYYPITVSSTIAGVTYGSTGTTASSTASTLTIPSSLAQNLYYPLSGTLTQALDIVFPAAGGFYGLNNQSSGSFTVSAYPSGSSALAIAVQQGGASLMYMNATLASELDSNQGRLDAIANTTVLGNISGSSAAPTALTLGTGIRPSSSTSTISAPGFAPQAAFKNLSIKVASNTTVTVAADFVTVTDGTYYLTVPVSATCNLGSAGSVNQLDSGTVAAATWYSIWVISDGQGTNGTLASTSATAPTLPAGYTFKARIGWVRTAAAVAQLLGSWQFNRRAQYVVGLAQTSALPIMASGTGGTWSTGANPQSWASTATTNFAPTTACMINVLGQAAYASGTTSDFAIAPNGSYGGAKSVNPPPLSFQPTIAAQTIGLSVWMTLESAAVYWVADGGFGLYCIGWEDNL